MKKRKKLKNEKTRPKKAKSKRTSRNKPRNRKAINKKSGNNGPIKSGVSKGKVRAVRKTSAPPKNLQKNEKLRLVRNGKVQFLTEAQARKKLKPSEALVYSQSDQSFRVKKYLNSKVSDEIDFSDITNRDSELVLSILSPVFLKLINRASKLKGNYEAINLQLEYYDGSALDYISTPLRSFDNYDISRLDAEEIFNLFVLDDLEKLVEQFLQNLEKYRDRKESNSIYFSEATIVLHENLVVKKTKKGKKK